MEAKEVFGLLLVDDETSILNALKRLFYRYNYQVYTASDAAQAFTILSDKSVAVVISDMKMPEMGGAEFLKAVAGDWPETVRIALTGYSDLKDTINVVNEAGIFRYISKPWDDEELVHVVQDAFNEFEALKSSDTLKDRTVALEREVVSQKAKLDKASSELASSHEGEKRLRDQRMEAEKLNEAKSRFLASMSHEMRSPLNAVIAMNALLLESDLSEEQRELARLAYDGGQTLLALINDVLDFSKIEAGKLQLNQQWFNLVKIVENVSELMASQAINKPVEIVTVFAPGTPMEIFGDETRFRQILINIVSNAVKFTEHGGVYIKVSPLKAGIQVYVKDTGIGIAKEEQTRIFEDFFQADNSSKRSYGGTGLGLSICNKLLKLMGGHISVSSEEQKGSCFRIYLPIQTKNFIEDTSNEENLHLIYLDSPNHILFNGLRDQLHYFNYEVVSHYNLPKNFSDYSRLTLLYDVKNTTQLANEYKEKIFSLLKAKGLRIDINNIQLVGLIANDSIGQMARLKEQGFPLILRKPIRLEKLISYIIHSSAISSENKPDQNISRPDNNHKTISRQSILLVEDSPANQAVVKAVLNKKPYDVDVANNGLEALDRTARKKYDIILMDLAMPLMDGIQATHAIRENTNANQSTTIIAMTANAFAEDREKCLDAGMDDFISKPIDVGVFLSCLEKWQFSDTEKKDEPASDSVTVAGKKNIDKSILDINILQQLLRDTSAEILYKIIDIYAEETEKRIPIMLNLHSKKKWKELSNEAHALKSSSGSFAAVALQKKAQCIEASATALDIASLESDMNNFEGVASKSLIALKKYQREELKPNI